MDADQAFEQILRRLEVKPEGLPRQPAVGWVLAFLLGGGAVSGVGVGVYGSPKAELAEVRTEIADLKSDVKVMGKDISKLLATQEYRLPAILKRIERVEERLGELERSD